jgi:hypothetical protein
MNERAEPLENGELIEALIESQDIEAEHEFCDPQGKSPPTFCTMLLFHRTFCEFAFVTPLTSCCAMIQIMASTLLSVPMRCTIVCSSSSWEEKEYSTNADGDIVETTTRGLFFGKFIESL